MLNIESFLARFRVMRPPQTAVRGALAQAILDVTGARVEANRISLRNESAFVQVPPAVRTEILVHKSEILARVEENSGVRLRDVR